MKKKTICLLPEITSIGGPAAFQRRFAAEAQKQGVTVHYDGSRADIGAYLVIGAPRRYFPLLIAAKRKGIPIIHRLNGMNWLHRVRRTNWFYSAKAETANSSIAAFRRHLATKIVYQSPFCEAHWNTVYGKVTQPARIIYNGVDTAVFAPQQSLPPRDGLNIMVTEGNLQHGSDFLLDQAVLQADALSARTVQPVALRIAGNAADSVKTRILAAAAAAEHSVTVQFLGVLSKEALIAAENASDFLFSAEIHPACPNAVIEALACGLPVVGFDTGSLKDITGDGGVIVPYGANAWKLEAPVLEPLVEGALTVIERNAVFRQAARQRAVEKFSIEQMTKEYLAFCLR